MTDTGASLRTLASVARLHIVAIAALGTLTFGWLFTGERPWALAGVAAVDWFVVNLLNRVVDLKEDQDNGILGTDLVARRRRLVLALGFGLLLSSLALTLVVAPALLPWRVAFQSLGLAYNWPLLPGRRRIKELYFWKNTASAVGFVLTVFLYPLSASGALLDAAKLAPGITATTVLVAVAFFFLFELSFEVIYDLRDAPGDARAGVRTYPVVHGERAAVAIIDALLAVSAAILVASYLLGAAPWRLAIMAAAPGVQALYYKRALRRGITSADCVRITWMGAALLATYHLWIVLDLPGAR